MVAIPGLEAKKKEVVKAAIAAEMSQYGFFGSCEKGFVGSAKATQENPQPPRVWVSWPQATVHHELTHDQSMEHLEPVAPAAEIFEKWPEEISRAFKRYEDVPDPGAFQADINVLKHISLGLQLDDRAPQGKGPNKRPPETGNADLAYLVGQMVNRTEEYTGETMRALHGVLFWLDRVIAHHHYIAEVLHVLVTGEQRIWEHLQDDVWETAEQARGAFAVVAGGEPVPPKTVLKVVKSVTEALAAVSDSKVVGVVAAAFSIANDWTPDPPEPAPVALKGSSAEEILTNLNAALDRLDEAAYHQEWALAECAQAATADMSNASHKYQLKAPRDFLGEDDADDLFQSEELSLRTDNLRVVGGEAQRAAGVLDYIRTDLQTTLGSSHWDRDPKIGLGKWGPYGHYAPYEELHGDLTGALNRLARDLRDIAEQSIRVSYDFDRTEGQIEEELRRHASSVTDTTDHWLPYGY